MPRPLDHQIVVITGASSGIGRATARLLATRGAAVVLAARDDAALQETAREITERGGRAQVVPTDVADAAQVQRLAQKFQQNTGPVMLKFLFWSVSMPRAILILISALFGLIFGIFLSVRAKKGKEAK